MLEQLQSTEDVYTWAWIDLSAWGMGNIPFADGGQNMKYLAPGETVGLDGQSPTVFPAAGPKVIVQVQHDEGQVLNLQVILKVMVPGA
jgi:hypothetical protein